MLFGRNGVQDLVTRMGRWNVGWRWWAVALSPIAFAAVAWPVARVVEGSWPSWPAFGRFNGLPDTGVLATWLLITLLNGFGEETGWRGYLLPHLQRGHSPLASTMVLTVIWALWHAPSFFFVASFEGMSPAMLPMWVLGLAMGAVVLTWLYNRSGGSVLLVAIWHGSYNLVSGTAGAEGTVQVVVSGLVVALAIHLIVRERQSQGHGPLAPIASADTTTRGPVPNRAGPREALER
jgi:membrane protease YdiL (CAAX protease family)